MALDLFNLTGKTALVTGGSKGLGKAMARGLEVECGVLGIPEHERTPEGPKAMASEPGEIVFVGAARIPKQDRLVLMPMETSGLIGTIAGIAELTKGIARPPG